MTSNLSGAHFGPYDILSPLGAGGMGEVYRAKDTKLGRDVALKILPTSFTNDPERVARFRREAQVLASLNHPHIAQIYGLEEVDGTQFLVLELVDGESPDKRIARGPIPVEEALGIARQIAELPPRTICTFAHEFSLCTASGRSWAVSDLETVLAVCLNERDFRFSWSSPSRRMDAQALH